LVIVHKIINLKIYVFFAIQAEPAYVPSLAEVRSNVVNNRDMEGNCHWHFEV